MPDTYLRSTTILLDMVLVHLTREKGFSKTSFHFRIDGAEKRKKQGRDKEVCKTTGHLLRISAHVR